MSAQFGKVGVVMGGTSSEREVSLRSGNAVLKSLLSSQVDAVAIDASHDLYQLVKESKIDRAFNVLHGRGGEDGQLQALLNFMEIPYTGSDAAASAIAMDKLKTKKIWISDGLPTPNYVVLHTLEDCYEAIEKLGLPMFVKPVGEGSSVGVSKVSEATQVETAWRHAKQYGDVIAEKAMTGGEYTTAIVAGEALPIVHMQASNDFYDYSAKYLQDDTKYFCPSGLDTTVEQLCQQISLQAANAIGMKDWGRIDFMLDEKNQMQLIELNTVPGMTNHSLVPMAAKQAGMSFDELVLKILTLSVRDENE